MIYRQFGWITLKCSHFRIHITSHFVLLEALFNTKQKRNDISILLDLLSDYLNSVFEEIDAATKIYDLFLSKFTKSFSMRIKQMLHIQH